MLETVRTRQNTSEIVAAAPRSKNVRRDSSEGLAPPMLRGVRGRGGAMAAAAAAAAAAPAAASEFGIRGCGFNSARKTATRNRGENFRGFENLSESEIFWTYRPLDKFI